MRINLYSSYILLSSPLITLDCVSFSGWHPKACTWGSWKSNAGVQRNALQVHGRSKHWPNKCKLLLQFVIVISTIAVKGCQLDHKLCWYPEMVKSEQIGINIKLRFQFSYGLASLPSLPTSFLLICASLFSHLMQDTKFPLQNINMLKKICLKLET